jgi:hypothetical protein
MSLTSELLGTIQKNIPQHVGEVLAEELAELARLRLAEPQWLTAKERLDEAILKLRMEVLQHTEALSQHTSLEAREKAVAFRESKADLSDLRVELYKEMRDQTKDMFVQVFRSPVVTRTLTGTIPLAVEGMAPGPMNQYGTPGTVVQGNVGTVETSTEK